MNRYEMYQQTNSASSQKGVYTFGLRSGTVVTSTAKPADRQFEGEMIAPVHAPRPSARRMESELWRLVLTDKLTGLSNQHGFTALAEQEWRVSRRTGREMVFVCLELAGMEAKCDGTLSGKTDLALIAAARILTKTFRRTDVICRWGADEFRVLAVDGEGLDEMVLRARIQYQVAIAGVHAAEYPLVFNGLLARVHPLAAGTFAGIIAHLGQEFDELKQPWCGTTE
jgi:diguanylate cyclase (GGDEF)-like protein